MIIKPIKKIIASIIAIAIFTPFTFGSVNAVEIFNIIYEEDFNNTEIGSVPDDLQCEAGNGNISVRNLYGEKALLLQNNTDGSPVFIEKTFEPQSKNNIIYKFDFMQMSVKSNYNTLVEFLSDGVPVISVVTRENGIQYKLGNDKYVFLLTDYAVNRWYKFQLEIDLTQSLVTIYIDGECTGKRLSFFGSASNGINGFRSVATYSPGYALDNLKLYIEDNLSSIAITGPDTVSIPKVSQTTSAVYGIELFNLNNERIKSDDVIMKMQTDVNGVTLTRSGAQYILEVDNTAANGDTVVLIAESTLDSSITANKSVLLKNAEEALIKIRGDAKITTIPGQTYYYRYTADIYDQTGQKIQASEVDWSLEGNVPAGIRVNNSGLLSVSGKMKRDNSFILTATSKNSGITANKKIVMLDRNTYIRDEARVKAVIEWADNVLDKGRDIYRGTPLLADAINRFTDEHFRWRFKIDAENPTEPVLSNIAAQTALMKSFVALSALTDDETYKNRVYEIYQYHWDNGLTDSNGLPFMGNHSCINLETGKQQHGTPERNTLEISNVYLEPFFQLNQEKAANMVRAHWGSRILDWTNLNYSRHGKLFKELNLENTWYNTGGYKSSDLSLIYETSEIPYAYAGMSLVESAGKLYKNQNDKNALFWAQSLLERFMAHQNEKTGLFCTKYTKANGAPNVLNPMTSLQPYGAWWLAEPLPEYYYGLRYGDRVYNQYADDLVKQGFVKESQKEKVLDCFFIEDGRGDYGEEAITQMNFAKDIGIDTPTGKKVMDYIVRGLAAYSKYGYNEETNDCNVLLSDGTNLTGFQVMRSGYYGKAGNIISTAKAYEHFFVSYARAYDYCHDKPEYEEETKLIWRMLRGEASGWGLGNIGTGFPGDKIDLDFNTNYAHPYVIIGLVELYKTTGIHDYLDLARTIADNAVMNNYKDKLFYRNYTDIVSFSNIYTESLLYLEETIRQEEGLVPQIGLGFTYFDAYSLYDNDAYTDLTAIFAVYQSDLPTVKLRDFSVDTTEVVLRPGESKPINITYKPSDAANKSILYDTSNPAVAYAENGVIYAVGDGKATIYCAAPGSLKKRIAEIKVSVERN